MFLIVGHSPNFPLWDFVYNQYEEDGAYFPHIPRGISSNFRRRLESGQVS